MPYSNALLNSGCWVIRLGRRKSVSDCGGLGKWRFILARGIIGFGVPMFLWSALTSFSEDVHSAGAFHQHSTVYYLFHSWLFRFCISAFLGSFVGLLAWKRLASEVWPGSKPDPESSITTLGPLS